jgi:uncharacterized membrane protein YphA (DoxX/SURF4 family)
VQKLFTSFPVGAPGFALLLWRCALSFALVEMLSGTPVVIRSSVGLFLVLGVLTPIVASTGALMAIFEFCAVSNANVLLLILLVAHGIALALLGPGAYSIDARLFGRRVVVWPKDSSSSD